ncbi:MAG: type II toxin-antitoxin system RelE/ParE family toxin [bacterium]|nr:type II toxin-antitoxin system RelE/ParE family toxin [bacterium]
MTGEKGDDFLKDIKKGQTLLSFNIEYSPDAVGHLKTLTARQQRLVLDSVEEQLASEPLIETRHRKPMRPNPVAPWELRIGNLRVYYDIELTPTPVVVILAIGIKLREKVRIGNEVVNL